MTLAGIESDVKERITKALLEKLRASNRACASDCRYGYGDHIHVGLTVADPEGFAVFRSAVDHAWEEAVKPFLAGMTYAKERGLLR